MAVKPEEAQKITNFVKKEPRTIQEVSKLIGKSWVTTDKYVQYIKERTGLIDIKTFRKGTQGALKLVYYNFSESLMDDEVREELYRQIMNGKNKTDFDFMELFHFVDEKNKRSFTEQYYNPNFSTDQQIMSFFGKAENHIYVFSGNLSFIHIKEKDNNLLDIIEELLQRKVMIKIISRVNLATMNNLNTLKNLMNKYPNLIEIKHRYQPLRGFIIDDRMARFKGEELLRSYKDGEMYVDTRIFYEVFDENWISWLKKVFWNMFRPSIDYNTRLKELKRIS